jgi:hypothetical protein
MTRMAAVSILGLVAAADAGARVCKTTHTPLVGGGGEVVVLAAGKKRCDEKRYGGSSGAMVAAQ